MPDLTKAEFRNKMGGALLGTALGDALGFIAEGLSSEQVLARFGNLDRFYVLGNRGFVTDDTEQSALVAWSIARNPSDDKGCITDFRRALLGWFLCFPFGIGRATMRACMRIAAGLSDSGVDSAGNGAAMRAAPIGVFFYDRPERRMLLGFELARVTHFDSRAVDGALFVAELASVCASYTAGRGNLLQAFQAAFPLVRDPELRQALQSARDLAAKQADLKSAAQTLNGKPPAFIVNSLPFATFCFLRWGEGDIVECLSNTICGGGDTDTNAAIVGAWLGALKGQEALPSDLIARIDDGPFGPAHLMLLADCLTETKFGGATDIPSYSLAHSAIRNILLIPVILSHATLRLLPAGSRKSPRQ